MSRKFGPLPEDVLNADMKPCAACGLAFKAGDYTTLVALGPGDDEEARERCRAGRPYNAVAVQVHYACATGEET